MAPNPILRYHFGNFVHERVKAAAAYRTCVQDSEQSRGSDIMSRLLPSQAQATDRTECLHALHITSIPFDRIHVILLVVHTSTPTNMQIAFNRISFWSYSSVGLVPHKRTLGLTRKCAVVSTCRYLVTL